MVFEDWNLRLYSHLPLHQDDRQLGNLKGRVVRGWSSDSPWQAKPNVYPKEIPTGTATALPTCIYLKKKIN